MNIKIVDFGLSKIAAKELERAAVRRPTCPRRCARCPQRSSRGAGPAAERRRRGLRRARRAGSLRSPQGDVSAQAPTMTGRAGTYKYMAPEARALATSEQPAQAPPSPRPSRTPAPSTHTHPTHNATTTRKHSATQRITTQHNATHNDAQPQVFRQEQYSKKCDVFSFAVIAFELFEGTLLVYDHLQHAQRVRVCNITLLASARAPSASPAQLPEERGGRRRCPGRSTGGRRSAGTRSGRTRSTGRSSGSSATAGARPGRRRTRRPNPRPPGDVSFRSCGSRRCAPRPELPALASAPAPAQAPGGALAAGVQGGV